MVYFVGAGPGAVDLITVRGRRLLRKADLVVYAGSLVNPALLGQCGDGCRVLNSASMTLEEVLAALIDADRQSLLTVRLHTGDPSLYGAVREQMDGLGQAGISFEVVPGVSSFSAAAAALGVEYTLPGISQSLIITRVAGRTPVPAGEDIASLAAHGASMAVFLSAGLLDKLTQGLLDGGYPPDSPAALVYKASWPEERLFRTTVAELARTAEENDVSETALVLVGGFLGDGYRRSSLYDPGFSHKLREARQ